MNIHSKWKIIENTYIENKLGIIPILPNSKLPAISKWNKNLSYETLQILYWFESNHNMNFGLPCKENNLFVLDLDKHNIEADGVKNFKKLCDDLKINIPTTLIQETPSGGYHYIFDTDDDLKQVNGVANAFKDYPGIDIRNSNYIVVAPSQINGKPYRFINSVKPQAMPYELKQFILDNAGTKTTNKKTPYKKPKEVYKGDRDNQLFNYVNNLYYKTRLDEEEILVLANYFNENILEEPFSERDVKYKVRKAFEKERPTYIIVNVGDE